MLPPKPCPTASFAGNSSAICKSCRLVHATTLVEAASSEADCCCDTGYFMQELEDGTRECFSCTDAQRLQESQAASCNEPGIELLTLPLQRGFWRVNAESTFLRKCANEDACAGGTVCGASGATDEDVALVQWPQYRNATARACRPSADNLCREGHRGPLCQVCVENWYQPMGNGICASCDGADSFAAYSTSAAIAIVVIATVLLCCIGLRVGRRRRANKGIKAGRPSCWHRVLGKLTSDSFRNKATFIGHGRLPHLHGLLRTFLGHGRPPEHLPLFGRRRSSSASTRCSARST